MLRSLPRITRHNSKIVEEAAQIAFGDLTIDNFLNFPDYSLCPELFTQNCLPNHHLALVVYFYDIFMPYLKFVRNNQKQHKLFKPQN